ncbi:MAG: hypothetical protein K6G52_01315 [Treponemataceae bacterium]|nr:hypothetical protein [Treponemataceae bacterium]
MNDDVKKKMDKVIGDGAFIRLTDNSSSNLTAEQKVILNRKGNELFNEGKINEARKLFITTGYSDGLTRCGDVEAKQNRELEALKLYWLAHNKRKSEPLIDKISTLISLLLKEEE